ncbi:MAG: DUF4331 family protein [Cellvibrionales bacterium]|nr:DUF4331 family protein [Cellvibrionales bacterium]
MKNLRTLLLITSLLFGLPVYSSDHVDGQISIQHPVADITDLYTFVSPTKKNHLVLILNSYPFVPSKGHFSEKLTYSFLLSGIQFTGKGIHTAIKTQHPLMQINCYADNPHASKNYPVTCDFPSGDKITTKNNQSIIDSNKGISLFAGKRADPFLFDSSWFSTLVFDYRIPEADASNNLTYLNVLSIAIEIDLEKQLPNLAGKLISSAGQISDRDNPERIIDRAGRPEISNAHLVTTKGEKDLRKDYNEQASFAIKPSDRAIFKQRLISNMHYYDNLDSQTDWPNDWKNVFAEILLLDTLITNSAKPFNQSGYLSLEKAALRQQPTSHSGGRTPNENVINIMMTHLVNQSFGLPITSGIPSGNLPLAAFPYLAEPNTGILNRLLSYFAPKATAKMALTEREKK